MAERREMCSTSRIPGYERVKMGRKMAARYNGSRGEVKEEAMMVPGPGR